MADQGNKLSCEVCKTVFQHDSSKSRHKSQEEKRFACSTCQKMFKRKDNLNRHTKNCKPKEEFACNICENSKLAFGKAHKNVHEKPKKQYIQL